MKVTVMSNIQILTALPRELYNAGYDAPKYRNLYNAAIDGRFPASQGENGRWTFCADEIETIARALGLSKRHACPKKGRSA